MVGNHLRRDGFQPFLFLFGDDEGGGEWLCLYFTAVQMLKRRSYQQFSSKWVKVVGCGFFFLYFYSHYQSVANDHICR